MKNNKNIFFLVILSIFFSQTIIFADIFNFETSEIQILNKGNTIKAMNGGKVLTEDNMEINADEFEYDKAKASLTAKGNIELIDADNQLINLCLGLEITKFGVGEKAPPLFQVWPPAGRQAGQG